MEICQGGFPPTLDELIAALQTCRQQQSLHNARRVHIRVCEYGLNAHGAVGNHLIPMYVDCSGLPEAAQIFNTLPVRNEHSWTSLIEGHVLDGSAQLALSLFSQMQEHSVSPSIFTNLAVLKACTRLRRVGLGREMHACIVKDGYETDSFVGSVLMDMYMKCGSLIDAKGVHDDLQGRGVVPWTVLIAGYVEYGLAEEALLCMDQMQSEGVSPNDFTYACSVKACGNIGGLTRGREIHTEIVQVGLETDLFLCNTLLDMYVRCHALTDALELFDTMSSPNVVSWTALIAGYADNGFEEEALDCFHQMQMDGITPTALTFSCCLNACASLGAIEKGYYLHSEIVKQGLDVAVPDARAPNLASDGGNGITSTAVILRNALIDMYGKCGSMLDAQVVFDSMVRRDYLTWTSLIMGYAQHGEHELVYNLFDRMIAASMQPDEVTFLSVLTVCSHVGLVNEGYKYFEYMNRDFDINPSAELRNCMVDLLCRAGQLNEAVLLLKRSFARPSFLTWVMVLDACHKRGNLEIARSAFECALKLDDNHSSAYIAMSNILSNAKIWDDAASVDVMGAVIQACDY